jgi:hypothetical protein
MRERLQGTAVSRFAWSAGVGAFVSLAAIALDNSRNAALVGGAAACVAVFLALRLYGVSSELRP